MTLLQQLTNMDTHDIDYTNGLEIMRVPGGWLYNSRDEYGKVLTSVFVKEIALDMEGKPYDY